MNTKSIHGKIKWWRTLILCKDWAKGVKFATKFWWCKTSDFIKLFELAKIDSDGKSVFYDGKTEKMKERVNVGLYVYAETSPLSWWKSSRKITGPYSLVQQPVGWKSSIWWTKIWRDGGLGIEAYGATNVLKEMLTTKSDDVDGRTKLIELLQMVKMYQIQVFQKHSLFNKRIKSFSFRCRDFGG